MACLKRLPKKSWTFLFFPMYSYFIFVLSTFYNYQYLPAYKSQSSQQEFNMLANCSFVPNQTFPSSHQTVYISTVPEDQKTSSNPSSMIILLWTWPSGHEFPLNQCPPSVDASSCFFTLDRSMYSMANAVVMQHRDVSMSRSLLPQLPRPPTQYWIWFSLEPPSNLRNLTMMDNVFNMTMSYRTDSDIFTPYGWLENHDDKKNFTIPQKTGLVAWVVSNWKTRHQRYKYFIELKQYIQVDVYGKNHLPLPRNQILQTLSKYKFYLAFENSIHEDYITEKLWRNSFLAGTVPVVLGPPRKNYERFIPPDSFIHVEDFPSVQELASYLHSLDQDDQKYQQYFNWRSRYQPVKPRRTWVTEYCKVCKAMKEAPIYRTIPSIAEWFR